MRQFMLGLSISVAFILGCVTAQQVPGVAMPSASASTTTYSGQRWEYACARTMARTLDYEGTQASWLNAQGSAGWELIPLDFAPGVYCFERPL